MPRNIITTPEQKFSDELKKELKGAKSAKFAVGWFFISGLKELKDGIDGLESLRILISPSTNRHTAETMLMTEKFVDEAVSDILETQYYQTPEQKKEILENEATKFLEKAGKLKPSKENAEFIAWLAQKLAEKKISIRIYTKEIFHAKVYVINKDESKSVVFTGSSNISVSGFTTNTEVNVRLSDEKQVKKLATWFDEKWKLSKDCDFTVLAGKALEESWALNKEVTPFRIYLRILHDIFSLDDDREKEKIEFNEDVPKLFPFQKDAVIDAFRRLQKYRGVFLADVPGLGKTYMGSALLAHLQEEGERAIVICSPKIQEQWEQVLDDYNVNAKVISRDHNKIAEIINDDRMMQRQVILIDENDWQILSLLECDASTAAVPVYENHHEITETIRLVFQDRANEIENNRCGYLELLKRQVLDRIEKAKRSQNEDTKKWMSLVQGSVRLVKLDIKLSRELRGVIRQRHGLTPKEMVEKIETLLKNKIQINKEPAKKLYSEIVLSESLK